MASGGTGSATTIRSKWSALAEAGSVTVFLAGLAALGGIWVSEHVPAAAVEAYSGVAAVAFIWVLIRVLRIGVRFDDRGITIRRPLRTYRIGWPQVSHLTDGQVQMPNEDFWVLQVVLRDGSVVRSGWMVTGRSAPAEMVERIKECAARYGISAELTGIAAMRVPAALPGGAPPPQHLIW